MVKFELKLSFTMLITARACTFYSFCSLRLIAFCWGERERGREEKKKETEKK